MAKAIKAALIATAVVVAIVYVAPLILKAIPGQLAAAAATELGKIGIAKIAAYTFVSTLASAGIGLPRICSTCCLYFIPKCSCICAIRT